LGARIPRWIYVWGRRLLQDDIKTTDEGEINGGTPSNIKVTMHTTVGKVNIVNIYAREGTLKLEDLDNIGKVKHAIIIGDLNAKNRNIIPHTQKSPYNSNGTALWKYLDGEGDREPSSWTIHNVLTVEEYTHTNRKGDGWSQIDYFISTPEVT